MQEELMQEELTEEEMQQKLEERLQVFGYSMAKQRDEWVRDRYSMGVDKRWVEDQDQYDGKDNINKAASQMMTSVEQGYPVTTQHAKPHRSTVFIGMTRQKTNAAEARLADILLPTDDRNWGIVPTPEPKLMAMAQNTQPAINPQTGQVPTDEQGRPLQVRDIAREVMEMAKVKAEEMQTVIDDQLTECDYNGELRKVIHDAAVLGTGVLKGPIVMNKVRKAWQPYVDLNGEQIHQIVIMEELNPTSYRVDPRNLFPDPGCGECVQNGKGIYEREQLTARQVRELAKQPGYLKDQIRKVLEEGPRPSAAMQEIKDEDSQDLGREVYEKWEYWGEVDREDLRCAGVDLGEDDDPLTTVNACVVMINNTVVKAFINPLNDGQQPLPYDFFVWEICSGSTWGYGIPYLMRAQQKVLNAAWRQMMDNAGVSSGPQIVVKPTAIQPADKQWQLSSRKIWYATDDLADVRTAFATFEFDSHQAELANIISMATELADQEIGLPMIAQGEAGAVPDTVGGMQILMNAANVVLRRLVKQFDDMITRPHIRRYYDFNMLYNDNEEIKGDFVVDARGSSALLIRDIQNQGLLNLLAAATNPVFGMFLDPEKLFKKALQAQHIDPAEVFKSDDEIAQLKEQMAQAAAQPAPDPAMAVAQLRAEADIAKVQLRSDAEMQKLQMQQQSTIADLQIREELAMQEREAKLIELQLQREIEMLKLAQTKELTLEQIKAKLADTALKERGRKELFAAEAQLKSVHGSGI